MPQTIIASNPTFTKDQPLAESFINVAEFFCDTIQGENFVGWPATFLRVQGCTQSCAWCDTKSVWRFGNPYTINELLDFMEKFDLPRKFKEGQHFVLTGGSPVLQQDKLIELIHAFYDRFGFKPFIEIENECTLMPNLKLTHLVDLWNNSPKLKSSGNKDNLRYRPEILKHLSSLKNSWFKFVVGGSDEEWIEIRRDFLDTHLIRRGQIVLMPLGGTRAELINNRQAVIDLAIRENVRYTTREHIVVWDKQTGI